ncbi:MAG: Uma2 family endonuclease [Candidatus Schekmanbacteria bacterium]|nr:Uma2 family endonuclease [Candidatus Schekmanbacteria bacterium]
MPLLREPKVGELVEVVLTYDDYCALPNDGRRYEILEGDLYVTPAPTTRHQRVSRNLQWILHDHVTHKRLGEILNAPIDVILSDTNVCQPDLVFIAAERRDIVTEKNLQGAPTLLVEILSPSSRRQDVTVKMNVYAKHGVPHYWILDPDARTVDEYVLEPDAVSYSLRGRIEGSSPFRSAALPDLAVDLGEVWA